MLGPHLTFKIQINKDWRRDFFTWPENAKCWYSFLDVWDPLMIFQEKGTGVNYEAIKH